MKKLAKVELLLLEKKRAGRPKKVLDTKRIAALRAKGLGWKRITDVTGISLGTIYRQGLPQQFHRPPGRPLKIIDLRRLENIHVPVIDSPLQAMESLLIFDGRCLDKETRQELLRLIPQLIHVRRAWRAEYMECRCICCAGKNPGTAPADSAMRAGAASTRGCETGSGK